MINIIYAQNSTIGIISNSNSRAAAVVRLTRSLLDPELFPHTAYVKIFATLARKTVN